ncbi:hypothetical protein FEM03_18450 [Phragmitibacter flavus]|uniref:Uncharacterized protein n=1 Tax=Phragmitibacter flavus TaxID=2576071 RepID=A0A5R8KAK5_9BACT|nr:hypothetical protein [Phragmitibacter flavus]TLD69350.1 hypothetical protein FEM03_18450 [Phragmitibacter flavus]
MRFLIPVLFVAGSLAFADSPGDATDTPDVVAKMVQGLAASKLDHLTSKTYKDGDREFSYHLKTIDYLGTVQRDEHRYTIAAAKFLRSSAKGSAYPPARGHGFIIVFDEAFDVATHGRMDFADYYMDGHVLKVGETVVADFGSTDPVIRHHGWLLDSAFMPYPFADRISEADWQSGAFRKEP